MTTATPSLTPVADQLVKARADLTNATTAAKLATAKRARLAAEVRALEAEAELERYRLQGQADRERADGAEAALERERAAHLVEEREHATEIALLKGLLKGQQPTKRAAARKATSGTNGYATTATPHESAAVRIAMLPAPESLEPSVPAEPDPISDRAAGPGVPRP